MVSTTSLSGVGLPRELKAAKVANPYEVSTTPELPTGQQATLFRQNTMEFIGSLLKGVDTPDEPLPQLFDGLVADFPLGVDENGLPQRMPTPALAAHCEHPVAAPAAQQTNTATKTGKRQASAAVAPLQSKRPRREASMSTDFQQLTASRPPVPAKKAKNPKRADRRRTIARFTTAILRAGGSNAFIARDGLGYRKAFDRFLVETYGETFAEGGYWYENARVEPFFRVLFHVATEGRVNLDESAVNSLFCKREKRQAAEWLLDEQALAQWGVTAHELAQIFEGPPSKSAHGFVRGTPLAVPTDLEVESKAPAPAPTMAAPNPVMAAPVPVAPSHPQMQMQMPQPAYINPQAAMNAYMSAMHRPGSAGLPPSQPYMDANMYAQLAQAHYAAATAAATKETQAQHVAPSTQPPSLAPISHEIRHLFDAGVNATIPRRQYSSDLSRLMSDFNANPSTSDDFLKSFLMRTASELDALSGGAAKAAEAKGGVQPAA